MGKNNLDRQEINLAVLTLSICTSLAFVIPFHFFPYAAFYNDLTVIFGIAIAFAFLGREKKTVIYIPWITALPVGLAIVISMQAAFGMLIFKQDAIFPVAYLIMAALAIVLGSSIATWKNGLSRICTALAWAFLTAGLVSVVISLIQFLGMESVFSPFILPIKHASSMAVRPFANLGQPNHLALLLCFSIASVWLLFQLNQLNVKISIIFMLVLVLGLVLTQSRIVWIIIPTFGFLAWYCQRKLGNHKVNNFIVIGFILLYIGLVIGLPFITASPLLDMGMQSAVQRIGTKAQSERLVLLQQAWHIAMSHPFIGAGWYQFGSQQIAIAPDFAAGPYARYAHNIILNFASELGWPITILIFITVIYWLYVTFIRSELSKEKAFAAFVFAGVIVHSITEFPLWYGYVLIPMALLMGAVHKKSKATLKIELPRIYLIFLFLSISVALISISKDYRRVIAGYRTLDLELIGLRFKNSATTKPEFTLFPQFYDYFQFAKTEASAGMSEENIAFSERVAKRFGGAPVLMDMSLIYALNGRQDDAVKTLRAMNQLHHCQYEKFYRVWKEKKEAESEKFEEVFNKLPKPGLNTCNSGA